jgi:hypothetical protein
MSTSGYRLLTPRSWSDAELEEAKNTIEYSMWEAYSVLRNSYATIETVNLAHDELARAGIAVEGLLVSKDLNDQWKERLLDIGKTINGVRKLRGLAAIKETSKRSYMPSGRSSKTIPESGNQE